MPVEFLTDDQAAGYAAFRGVPSRSELERFFFLDDADRELIEAKRRPHNRLGFAVLMTSARFLGVFLDDLDEVPVEVVDYLAEQLGIEDPSVLKAYGERENTRLEHARELRVVLEYQEFASAEVELRAWVDARAWTTGDGPKSLFDASVAWLRERRVLLPGVTTLARLVASVREAANQRLWATLYGLLDAGQRAVLDGLLVVPAGARISELDRLRHGPVRISGPEMKRALERVAEIAGLGMGDLDGSGIPPRRLAELSRYGMDGKASLLKRHGDARRLATLLATAVHLTTRSVDDALDLLEVLIATRLLARAERETVKQKIKTLPKVERAGAKLAAAFAVVLDTTSTTVDLTTGEILPPKVDTLAGMWEHVEAVVPRPELFAAIEALFELAPPLASDADEAWRAQLVTRFGTVRPFLLLLWRVDRGADYGAFNEAARGRVDLERIERHWEDILRIIGSIHTGAVRAYDVIRMLSRDGRPTPLGDAIAPYGRIPKSLHILRLADEPGYRRQIKVQANLQEGRHALARKVFHGRNGQLYQRYADGMEDQIGALGLVLNALVLFNTRYMDAAVSRLRADGFPVHDEDVARLSPFVRHHINMLGRYSFRLPDLPGGLRPLRDPDAADDE